MPTKKFRVQIFAYKMHADFVIESVDAPLDIENAIVDKLGKKRYKMGLSWRNERSQDTQNNL